jgi:hypothetical protein
VVNGFHSLGYQPEVRSLSSFQDDYGLEGDASDDSEEEDAVEEEASAE